MTVSNKDEVRKQLFRHKKFNTKIINIFDTELELRQPSVGDIFSAKDWESNAEAIASILINYAYVPSTNEKVFDNTEADMKEILSWPVGDWLRIVQSAAVELMNIDVEQAEGNLKETEG